MTIVVLSISMFAVALLVLVGLPAALTWIYEKSRSGRLKRVAAQLGLEFHEEEDRGLTTAISRFAPFGDGSLQCASNVIRADTDETTIRICDFSYAPARRDIFGQELLPYSVILQTVVYVSSTEWRLPMFEVLPKSISVLLAKILGMQDFKIREDPTFFAHFALQGTDETTVRALFSADVRDCFVNLRGNQVKGEGNSLLMFRQGRLSAPRIRELIQIVIKLHLAFVRFSEERLSADAEN